MSEDDKLFCDRMCELSARADTRAMWVYSDFLTEAQQNELRYMPLDTPYTLIGGYEGAERKICAFGDEGRLFYEPSPPFLILKISPKNKKFAAELSHRDFLGSLMGLGLRREMLGDIVISDNSGYVFVLEKASRCILSELVCVGSTPVSVSEVRELPSGCVELPEPVDRVTPSLRCDALLASVFSLSRAEAVRMIESSRVFIDGSPCRSGAKEIRLGQKVSLRGTGKFILAEVRQQTRSGKLHVGVLIFG